MNKTKLMIIFLFCVVLANQTDTYLLNNDDEDLDYYIMLSLNILGIIIGSLILINLYEKAEQTINGDIENE